MSRRVSLRTIALLCAAVTGLVVLTLSIADPGGSEPDVVGPPTLTAKEMSERSDRIFSRDGTARAVAQAKLIESGESVITIPHVETTARRNDVPPSLDEALASADLIVTGRVAEQKLEWGRDEVTQQSAPVLVSTITEMGGSTYRVVQPVKVNDLPLPIGLRLEYPEGHELLRFNETYALVVREDPADSARFEILHGHVYVLDPAGQLVPGQGVTPADDSVSNLESLSAQFHDKHREDQGP